MNNVGSYSSISIGSDGMGLISYHDTTSSNLKVAHCLKMDCSIATISTIDFEYKTGEHTSIAIGSDGLGLISYYDLGRGNSTNNYFIYDLKIAHCSNLDCSSATITTIGDPNKIGLSSSITIGTDGLGAISYYDATAFDLKFAH